MAGSASRVLYVGTLNGLFEAVEEGSAYRVSALGLAGSKAVTPLVDRADPRRLYAGTGTRGVFRSEDAGQTWEEINDGIIYKSVWSLAQHPQTGELYAGTEPSSVFKSADSGDTWQSCEHLWTLPTTKDWTFPNPPHVSHVKDIGLCADAPSLIFCAIEEGWLVRSQDRGATWENVKDGVDFDSHSVTYMPDDPSVVVATTGDGLFRSTDSGDHFVESTTGLDRRYYTPVVVHPTRPRVLYVAAAAVPPPDWRRREGADTGFYRSEDQGISWVKLSGGLPEHFTAAARTIAMDPESPDTFFVGMSDGSVWASEDGGESFQQIVAGLPHVRSLRVAYR
jgi:photosystem II stability/assembly factor-like uncharacterized protein